MHWSVFIFSCRRRHTRWPRDWSSDLCSSDLTARTPRRVTDRLRHPATDGRVIDAEIQDGAAMSLAKPRDDRVVGVQDHRRAWVKRRDRVADAARELIDLEVTIELVAEEIGDQHH